MPLIQETIRGLYQSDQPTNDPIIDQVIEALRTTNILRAKLLAKHMNLDYCELRHAWPLLTGSTLGATIVQWRILQALDLLADAGYTWSGNQRCKIPAYILQPIARSCGWRSHRIMTRVLHRHFREASLG